MGSGGGGVGAVACSPGVEGACSSLLRFLRRLIRDPNHLQHSSELVHLVLQSPGLRGGGAGDWTRDWPWLGQLPRSRHHSLLQQCVHHEPVQTRRITAHPQGWPKNFLEENRTEIVFKLGGVDKLGRGRGGGG